MTDTIETGQIPAELRTITYSCDMPRCVLEAAQAPEMRRLSDIDMSCGCRYTSFPIYRDVWKYSRLRHSVGVAMIMWAHTHDLTQTMAGLLHDIATPAFSHTIDFLNGDLMKQESTEAGIEEIVAGSESLTKILKENGLNVRDVCDHHKYPLLDNEKPKLSADRLEYTIGNIILYKVLPKHEAEDLYVKIFAGRNEYGEEEQIFADTASAERFAETALTCSAIYSSPKNRYAMMTLSEIIRAAMTLGVISKEELYTDEKNVINLLCSNTYCRQEWEKYKSMKKVILSESPFGTGKWWNIEVKKRYIDPFVADKGRLSGLSDGFSSKLERFLTESHNVWICAEENGGVQ